MRMSIAIALLWCGSLRAQQLLEGAGPDSKPLVLASDVAVLESGETRGDLPCAVRPVKPALGFDLVFHTGYQVSVPLRPLVGSGNRLTAVFRVVEEGSYKERVYFWQRWAVPPLEGEIKGTVDLEGAFVLGPGRYRVDWLLRDLQERYCTARWNVSIEPRGKEREVALRIGSGRVRPATEELFAQEGWWPGTRFVL